MSVDGRVHHVRSQAHGKGLPVVPLQHTKFPPFSKVSLASLPIGSASSASSSDCLNTVSKLRSRNFELIDGEILSRSLTWPLSCADEEVRGFSRIRDSMPDLNGSWLMTSDVQYFSTPTAKL